MRRTIVALALLGFGFGTPPAQAQNAPPPEAFVDALNAIFGVHKGFRASHAKGLCAEGSFRATPEAASLSAAPHFSGEPIDATVRLSVGGGNPKASDKGRGVRGMAVRFHLPGGDATDLVMISAPVFAARDPAGFLAFLHSRRPDPATGRPDPAKVKAHDDAHPESKAQAAFLSTAPVPASYAHAPFWGINAFHFLRPDGQRQPARWVVEPVAGIVGLTEDQLKTMPDEFLADEFRSRLARGPAEWDFYLQLAEPGDPLDDATVQWPAERRKVRVGRLAVAKAAPAGAPGECEAMMFDPLLLPKGIEASDDPILQIRSAVYAVSLSRRQ